jgi:hypothetical protein
VPTRNVVITLGSAQFPASTPQTTQVYWRLRAPNGDAVGDGFVQMPTSGNTINLPITAAAGSYTLETTACDAAGQPVGSTISGPLDVLADVSRTVVVSWA